MNVSTAVESGPRLLLQEHHDALQLACRDLMAGVYTDDTFSLTSRYRQFERAVLEHIDVEERQLVPGFTQYSRLDARMILMQHTEIRDQLYRLGIDLELHRARAERFATLIETLQRHVTFEEATLYPWARENLSAHGKREQFVRLGHSLRALSRLRGQA